MNPFVSVYAKLILKDEGFVKAYYSLYDLSANECRRVLLCYGLPAFNFTPRPTKAKLLSFIVSEVKWHINENKLPIGVKVRKHLKELK